MERYSYISKNQQEEKGSKQSIPSYYSSLHSIRKVASKPWNKKLPIAPLPRPTPPKIYKVDPINFKQLVQKLTAAPESLQTRRFQSSASPSLSPFGNKLKPPPLSAMYKDFSQAVGTSKAQEYHSNSTSNFLGLNLSSSSYNSCNYFPLLSPDTSSFLEQSTLL